MIMNNEIRQAIKTLYKQLYTEHKMTDHFDNDIIDLGDLNCLQLLSMVAMVFEVNDVEFNKIADEVKFGV